MGKMAETAPAAAPAPAPTPAPSPLGKLDLQTLIASIMCLIAAIAFFLPWAVGSSGGVDYPINGLGGGGVTVSGSNISYGYSFGWVGVLAFVFTLLAFIIMLIKALSTMIAIPTLEVYMPLLERALMGLIGLGFVLGLAYGGLLLGCVGDITVTVQGWSPFTGPLSGAFQSYSMGAGLPVFIVFLIISIVLYKRIIRLFPGQ